MTQEIPRPIDLAAPEMGRRAAEAFDYMYGEKNIYDFMLGRNGPDGNVLLMLGAVGGGGAGKKVSEMIQELGARDVPFSIMAMKNYMASNPGLVIPNDTLLYEVDDTTPSWEGLTENCFNVLRKIPNIPRTVISFGPRTPNPEAARRLGVDKIFIVDGAVPDTWNTSVGETGFPNTPYFLPAYQASTFITTSGWDGGWQPPHAKKPPGVEVVVKSQPFSERFVQKLTQLRNTSPEDARKQLINTGNYPELENGSIIVVSTMDKVYTNPKALTTNGGWLTPEQYGQSVASITAMLVGLSNTRIPSRIYLPEEVRRRFLPIIGDLNTTLQIFSRPYIPNQDYLLLRRAGVSVGRAPLCVSTAEELAMGNPFVMQTVPGKTSDGTSYMTESEATIAFSKIGSAKTIQLEDNPADAILEVAQIKGLLH